jgi:flagellar basal body-associated protein FliL
VTTIEKPADAPADAPAGARVFSRKVLIVVALVLALLVGGAVGALVLGDDETPAKKPTTGQPPEPRDGPDPAQLDDDAFAPVGEVGADQ